MKYFLFILFLISQNVFAFDQDDVLHSAAHFGGTYAITNMVGTGCKVFHKKNKWVCVAAGVVASTALNVAHKASEKFPKDTNRALISGGLGSVVSAFTLEVAW